MIVRQSMCLRWGSDLSPRSQRPACVRTWLRLSSMAGFVQSVSGCCSSPMVRTSSTICAARAQIFVWSVLGILFAPTSKFGLVVEDGDLEYFSEFDFLHRAR